MVESRKSASYAAELLESMKATIEILNNTDGVEVASPSWVNAMEFFENDAKLI